MAEDPTNTVAADRLLSMVAHELRGSLTGVLGILDLLVNRGAMIAPDEQPEMLVLAHRESLRMAGLLENLLTRARLNKGTLELSPSAVAISDVVRETLDIFPDVAKRTVVAVPADIVVDADRDALRQIIQNLIQNVGRYAPDGEVEVRAEREGDTVRLTVSDQGPGMPGPEDRPRALGLGIGLSLASSLAQRMNGSLQPVEPLKGGASMQLTLPATDETPEIETDTGRIRRTMTPRARLLAELSEALDGRNLDRTIVGIGALARGILGSTMVSMFVGAPGGVDVYGPAATIARTLPGMDLPDACGSPELEPVAGELAWLQPLGIDKVYHWRVDTSEGRSACLVVGFEPGFEPDDGLARDILPGIGRVAGLALDRSELQAELVKQKTLRSAVLESLPLAISVFEGDPPQLVDMNRKERELLGISDNSERPADLAASQQQFKVRFSDGTPLTVDNAPVTEAVRSAKTQGPFFLIVERADGTEVYTRTHCAPFFADDGQVAGAVVTSEIIDESGLP